MCLAIDLEEALSGGDRRSIGSANEVAALVMVNRSILPQLVTALDSEDVVVRMRASDALEKVSLVRAEWIAPHTDFIIDAAESWDEQEISWHAAQILPRLDLSKAQEERVTEFLFTCLRKKSRILRVFALTGLVDLARRDVSLQPMVMRELRRSAKSGIPSLEARARKLLRCFEGQFCETAP